MTKKKILVSIFILGLVYILAPGPTSVNDFPSLANSLKSSEPGDTVQVPNIAAYFSDYDRAGITSFYRGAFRNLYLVNKLIPPISLNYPPENANSFVRDQQVSTFLEEYLYPLRGSIFVNGYDPNVENEMKKRNHTFIGDHLHIQGRYFNSKTTLRFYPADSFNRLIVYFGIWIAGIAIYELGIREFRKNS